MEPKFKISVPAKRSHAFVTASRGDKKCRGCGHWVSSNESKCWNCGRPV